MKHVSIIVLLMITGLLVQAEETKPIKIYIEDFAFLEGAWEGDLEYLDFRDDETKVKLPVKVIVTKKTSTEDYQQYMQLKTEFKNPDGALIINEMEMKILDGGKGFFMDGEFPIQKKVVEKENQRNEYVFVGKKPDNNIPATIRQSVIRAGDKLMVKIEVKHDNTDHWFMRSQYMLRRSKADR